MNARNILASNIRKIRERRGWSQEELAARSGIHRTYISGIERSNRNPTIEILFLISKALNVRISSLLEE